MTGVLNVDTIADNAGTGPVTLTKQIAPKQWAKTNSAGTSIEDSYNTTSLTDNGTGDQTITMTNAMSNALYAVSIANHTQNGAELFLRSSATATTSSLFRTGAHTDSAYSDCEIGSMAIGDLA